MPLSGETCNDDHGLFSTDSNPAAKTASQKQQLTWPRVDVEKTDERSALAGELKLLKPRLKLLILKVFLCGVSLLFFVQNFSTCDTLHKKPTSLFSYLRSNAKAAVAKVQFSSPEVLEVFQVYQPVFTPSWLTDQTISSDGSSSTAAINSTETISSCTQLLMEHSFGFSYGHPYVGTSYFPRRET